MAQPVEFLFAALSGSKMIEICARGKAANASPFISRFFFFFIRLVKKWSREKLS